MGDLEFGDRERDGDKSPVVHLYGSRSCRYTAELRDDLLWQGRAFEEFDVEEDAQAFERLVSLTGGRRLVPVLVENGKVVQEGVQGRGCYVGAGAAARGKRADPPER